MKKTILLLALLTLSITTRAQISEGRSMLGGSVNYSQNSAGSGNGTISTKNSSFGSLINYGYLLSDHFMMGVSLGFNSYDDKYHATFSNGYSDNNKKDQSVSKGLFARYYQRISQSRFWFFGQLLVAHSSGTGSSYTYQVNNGSFDTEKYDTKSSIYTINLVPGIVYMINNKFGIETTVGNFGFISNTERFFVARKEVQKKNNNTIQGGLTLSSLNIGVHFYFGKTG